MPLTSFPPLPLVFLLLASPSVPVFLSPLPKPPILEAGSNSLHSLSFQALTSLGGQSHFLLSLWVSLSVCLPWPPPVSVGLTVGCVLLDLSRALTIQTTPHCNSIVSPARSLLIWFGLEFLSFYCFSWPFDPEMSVSPVSSIHGPPFLFLYTPQKHICHHRGT